MPEIDLKKVKPIITEALTEDIGSGDITTEYLVGIDEYGEATISVKEPCVIAGLPVAQAIFYEIDHSLKIDILAREGEFLFSGEIMKIAGRAANILIAERTVLNFLQRTSGVATITNAFVKKVEKYGTAIMDTRKTTPTLRYLEKYAVAVGGGINHRMGLFDAVLIKENHSAIAKRKGIDFLKQKMIALKKKSDTQIIIEVHSLDEIDDVLCLNPHVILFDNFCVNEVKKAVAKIGRQVLTEASGNITLENVEEFAQTGVDRLSIGRLTHSYKSIDMSLEIH
ncbi:carboxylating nicotinate-nucleotide diphosphorylase [Chlamydiota bacterium]